MLKNTTFNLPESLIRKAKTYASMHRTSVTAIIRDHLEAITAAESIPEGNDPYVAFVEGRMTKDQAVQAAGLRDYSELLIGLGERGLSLPALPNHELENQAATFARLWKDAG
ncbi:DUF6364 family protein [Phyllobacterium sp. LjRoot231]|uniref:DUF6364 family protein n=1 Tax=Phyllobacterium sp. LjRoot231 TaxID=3342289 RepID=UPI003ED04F57